MPSLFQRVVPRLVQTLKEYDDQRTAGDVLGIEGSAQHLEDFESAVITQLARLIDGIDWKNAPASSVDLLLPRQEHPILDDIIHFLDEGPGNGFASGAIKEIDGGLFPTEIRWFRADLTLLVKKTITRVGGGATKLKPTPIMWRIYETDGTTVKHTISDAVAYSGVSEIGRVRTIS
jgi:hypothetical protein